MKRVDEFSTRFLHFPIETKPVLESNGAVLAESLAAPIDLPRFTNAAMDGYAVRSTDVSASAAPLPVAVSIAAGDDQDFTLSPGMRGSDHDRRPAPYRAPTR